MVHIYVIGGVLYFTLIITRLDCFLDFVGDVRIFGMALVDFPLLPFPNNMYPLFFGVTGSQFTAMILTGIADFAFFWRAELFMQSRTAWVERVYAFAGYLLLSICTFFISFYLFFFVFFHAIKMIGAVNGVNQYFPWRA